MRIPTNDMLARACGVALLCLLGSPSRSFGQTPQVALANGTHLSPRREQPKQAAQNQRPLVEALKEIEHEFNILFVYSPDVVENTFVPKVLNREAFGQTMSQLLENTNLTYRQLDDTHYAIIPALEPKRSKTFAPMTVPPLYTEQAPQPLLANVRRSRPEQNVSGQVTDGSGEGIPGVNVLEKGTTNGTITDVEGRFALNVQDGATLVFSAVGYLTQELAVNNQSNVSVTLKDDVKALDEVVVVGYGEVKREDLTSAVSSVSGRELAKIPVSSTAQAITGRMAGVQVTTTDGSPDAEIVIRVRGGGSVTQDNSPLFIVDGFPVDNINNIPPTDIVSIDVLKDAASAAIYGARGANGVVIVTTKSAKAGNTSVSYNGYVQQRNLPRKLEVLSPYEFVLAQYEYAQLRGTDDIDRFTRYFGVYDDLELYKSQRGTDWQEELFGSPAYMQYHNVSVTGGTDRTKMSLSLTGNDDQGILVGSGYQRTTVNFKLNHKISDKLQLDLAPRFSNIIVDGAGTSGSSQLRISDGITTRPVNGLADQIVLDPLDAAGDYEQFMRSLISPLKLVEQDYRKRIDRSLVMNGGISWKILPELTYRSDFGIEYGFETRRRYYGPLTGESFNNGRSLPLAEITDYDDNRLRWANTLSYNLSKGMHSANILFGQEVLKIGRQSTFNRALYFDESMSPEKIFANMVLGTSDRYETYISPDNKLLSLFGRVNYQFNDRYLATLTLRADGSSKFAPGNRWGVFPAAALAWRISQEDFMQNLGFVSDLKLRASYGEAGNNRIDDNLWRRTYTPSSYRPIGFDDVQQTYWTAASSTLVNPDLKWETTVTRNLGLDFGLFKSLVTGTVELYYNTTKDLLVESDIPSYTGYAKQMRNIGQTSNRGVELTMKAYLVDRNDLSVSADFNIGINRARIDELDGVNERQLFSNWAGTDLKSQDDYRLIVGQTIGLIQGYVTDGFYTVDDFQAYDEATGNYILKEGVPDVTGIVTGFSGRVRPGMLKLKDLDGNGVITADGDRQVIGNALPKHSGGFGLNATYKGFDASVFFNWVYGNDVYNTGKISFNMYHRTTFGNMLNTMNSDNRFKYIDAEGQLVSDLESLRQLNQNATIWSPFSMGNAAPVVHSYAIEDGSFLRLSNATIGYSLPQSMISKLRMSQFRVYVTAYNAWLWTKYSGYDPEVSTTRSSSYAALTPGVDYSSYPKSRSFTIGVNVTF